MALSYLKIGSRLACALLVRGLIWSATGLPVPAAAQDVPADQIVNTLAPPITRSLTAPDQAPVSDADRGFIESLRHRTRSLTVDEGDRVADLAKDRPKKDLTIYFDYNSAAINAKAEPQLNELGKALRDSRLDNSVIVLSGYTDAKGSDEYNQKLSQRRAEAVRAYLIDKLKIPGANLSTVGYGKRDLLNKDNPFAAENCRVQIVNLSGPSQASR